MLQVKCGGASSTQAYNNVRGEALKKAPKAKMPSNNLPSSSNRLEANPKVDSAVVQTSKANYGENVQNAFNTPSFGEQQNSGIIRNSNSGKSPYLNTNQGNISDMANSLNHNQGYNAGVMGANQVVAKPNNVVSIGPNIPNRAVRNISNVVRPNMQSNTTYSGNIKAQLKQIPKK